MIDDKSEAIYFEGPTREIVGDMACHSRVFQVQVVDADEICVVIVDGHGLSDSRII